MKTFIETNKKWLYIAMAAIFAIALVAALLSGDVLKRSKPEPVPPGRIHDSGVFGSDITVHDSLDGEIVIEAPVENTEKTTERDIVAGASSQISMLPMSLPKLVSSPNEIWTEDTYAGNHTLVEKAVMTDGSIGILTIGKLSLSANVYESVDAMEDMDKGVAHFPHTSAFDGLVGLSAHNINPDGSDGYFKGLYTLAVGDIIQYETVLGQRTYAVSSITTIDASDWSPLHYQDSNQLALITCITGQPDKRLCVTAVEKK
jgi:LPXTG-site transpeptidase (sortase) family protein